MVVISQKHPLILVMLVPSIAAEFGPQPVTRPAAMALDQAESTGAQPRQFPGNGRPGKPQDHHQFRRTRRAGLLQVGNDLPLLCVDHELLRSNSALEDQRPGDGPRLRELLFLQPSDPDGKDFADATQDLLVAQVIEALGVE